MNDAYLYDGKIDTVTMKFTRMEHESQAHGHDVIECQLSCVVHTTSIYFCVGNSHF